MATVNQHSTIPTERVVASFSTVENAEQAFYATLILF